LQQVLHYDVAVDLGTAHIRVLARGRPAPLEEPAAVRVSHNPRILRSAGFQALAPDSAGLPTLVERPLRKGVVADTEAAGWLLATMLRRARGLSLTKPIVLACIPSDATLAETRRLVDAMRRAGVQSVTILPEPLAAAVGAGLDLSSSHAQLLVDVGDGVTDVAVLRAGEIEVRGAVRTACSDLRRAIVKAVAEAHGVLLPDAEAQRVLEAVAGTNGAPPAGPLDVRGHRAHDLAPATARVERADMRAALEGPLAEMAEAVCAVWQRLTPKTSCEVIESGMHLTGGGARLGAVIERLRANTGLDVDLAADPARAVIRGAGRMARLQ
jgi:rod shape-determining protein MreB